MTDAPPPAPPPKREINWTAVLTLLTAVVGLLTAIIAFMRETTPPVAPIPPTATATIVVTTFVTAAPSVASTSAPSSAPTAASTTAPTIAPSAVPVASATPARTPTLSVTPTRPAAPTPVVTIPTNEAAPFGTLRDFNGLQAVIGNSDLAAGCGGTLDFELILTNTTGSPIVLGFTQADLKLTSDAQTTLSIYGDSGTESPRCYSSVNVGTLAPNASAVYALRTTDVLTKYKSLLLTFGSKAGRLANQMWRLDLATTAVAPRPDFGQTLVSADGVEVSAAQANYFPGCNGTLGFGLTLNNKSANAVQVSLNSANLHIYGDSKTKLEVNSQLGAPSDKCYSSFNLPTLKSNESQQLAVRVSGNLAGLSYVDIVIEGATRLAGLRWRLQLAR